MTKTYCNKCEKELTHDEKTKCIQGVYLLPFVGGVAGYSYRPVELKIEIKVWVDPDDKANEAIKKADYHLCYACIREAIEV
jgi:hypothetical protein